MNQVLSDACNTNVGIVKQDGIKYLIPMFRIKLLNLKKLRDKTKCEFYNLVTGQMLVPYQRLLDFDSNPDE